LGDRPPNEGCPHPKMVAGDRQECALRFPATTLHFVPKSTTGDIEAMNASPQAEEAVVFRFGSFELTPARRQLLRDGRAVKVGSRAFDILVALVESAGRVISKDQLMLQVWSSVIVEDTNLRVHISNLRRLLGDDRLDTRYIVHVARRGYVFVAPVGSRQLLHLAPHSNPTAARIEISELE
jgi:DNA-binding winged helix-turn-helix (wHTH) protein